MLTKDEMQSWMRSVWTDIKGESTRRGHPAPYPVALGKIGADDEAEALVGFEWHMLQQLQAGKFVIRHPQQDGHCVSFREWVARDDGDEDEYDEDDEYEDDEPE